MAALDSEWRKVSPRPAPSWCWPGAIPKRAKRLRDRLGEGEHPGQCGVAGLDRYRPDAASPARDRRPERDCDGAYARRPLGEPKDFAGIAVFLAGAASDFVTGAAITVDGGYSVQG